MRSRSPKPYRKRDFPKKLVTKLFGQPSRPSSNVSAPALAAPSGGSQPQLRPDTPSDNIHPAANTEAGDTSESPAVTAGRPTQTATLHGDEENDPTPDKVKQEPQDAHSNAFECSENVPCFNEAVKRFKSMYGDRYKAIFEGQNSVFGMAMVDSGSDLASSEGSHEPMGGFVSFIQSCKTYLPSLGSVQTLAMALSRLDPHGIAPLVFTSVFFVINLTLNTWDPSLREKVLTLLSKSSTIMNKWILYEVAQARSTSAFKSEHTKELTRSLPGLYVKAFETISLIHQVCKGKAQALGQGRVPSIERGLSELERYDRTCASQKDKVDGHLKAQDENHKLLHWIRGEKNPEPSHMTVVCQTGLDKPDTQAALWFLRTSKFNFWAAGLAPGRSERVFWLEGIMGSGKTTLICRLISYFEQYPINETRVVFYYCYGSATEKQNRGPNYEDIIRGLCYRLTWNEGGEIAQPAKEFYQRCNSEHDRMPHTKRWEQLLHDLIIHSRDRLLFIIDALDECNTKTDQRKFLKFIGDMQQHGLYLILSSRPHIEVEEYFTDSIVRYSVVTTEAKKDMEIFINDQIAEIRTDPSQSSSAFLDKENLERLVGTLVSQANGMFRWAQLWLGVFFNPNHDSIVLRKTAKEMLQTLEKARTLPTTNEGNDMAQVYQQLWDINGDGDKSRKIHQNRAFRFVLAAERPLHSRALLDAIRFDPEAPTEYAQEIDMAYVRKLYHNFLRERRGFLEFEHVSAKTFILEMQDSASKQSLFADGLQNHFTIAETSLLLLKNPNHALWKEARIRWDSREEMIAFINDKRLNLKPFDNGYKGHVLLLTEGLVREDMAWIDFGRERLVRKRLEREGLEGDGVDGGSLRGGLAIYVLNLWLRHCRKIHDTCMDTSIRRLLLEVLRDIPLTKQYLKIPGKSWMCEAVENDPLIFALSHGLSPFHFSGGIDSTPTLGDIMSRNDSNETPLHIAVRQNDHRSTKALLEILSRAEPSVPLLSSVDDQGRNVLHIAKDEEIIQSLLEFEAKPLGLSISPSDQLPSSALLHARDDQLNTPMDNFLEHCSESLVLWIMERLDVRYWGVPGALYHPVWPVAVRCGSKRVIRLLLDQGASIDGVACATGTALGVAIANHNQDMVMFLLEQGADVNGPGGDYGTPLGVAVHYQMEASILLLLGHNDIDLDRAVRLSPDSDATPWNIVGNRSIKVANVLRKYGRRTVLLWT